MGETYFVVRRYKGSGDWFHITGGDGTAVAILMIPVILFVEFVRWLSHGRRWEVIRVTETVEGRFGPVSSEETSVGIYGSKQEADAHLEQFTRLLGDGDEE